MHVRIGIAEHDEDRIREEILEHICLWLNRAARKSPDRLNSIVLLRLLVEKFRDGLTGQMIEKLLNKRGDGWARRQLNRVRDDLENFRTGAGSTLAWRFEIETTKENAYVAVLKPNHPRTWPEAIWLPHVWRPSNGGGAKRNWLAFTEPVVFRDPDETFYLLHSAVRRPDVAKLLEKLNGARELVGELRPCSHYVSLGEVMASRTIERGLKEIRRDAVVGCTTNQETTWNQICAESFVLIGPWWNELIMAFQQSENRLLITAGSYGIRVLGCVGDGERATLENDGAKQCSDSSCIGSAWDLADTPGRSYFGVFTRISDRRTQQVKSVITSRHGAATDAIASYLFSENVRERLIAILRDSPWEGLPDNYQLLFKVRLTVGTERKGSAELLLFRKLHDGVRCGDQPTSAYLATKAPSANHERD